MHSSFSIYQFLSLLGVIALFPFKATGQWRTESFELKEGWNAIYLKVDTDDTRIGQLITDTRITEIWKWRPQALDQRFIDSPQEPVSGEEWQIWRRESLGDSSLFTLAPNAAYLVRLSNINELTLQVKGRVVGGDTPWRTDGLNLLGFSTPSGTPPSVEQFFGPSELVHQRTEIYSYLGGELETEVNPAQLDLQSGRITRGQAYWIRTNKYHDYDGPLKVRVALSEGLHFGEQGTTVRLVMTNRTNRKLTAQLTPASSETSPDDVTPAPVPLTLKNSEREFVSFDAAQSFALEAGETRGFTVGIDRSQLPGSPGDFAASLLKVTDSEGLSEKYLPVTAEVASLAGLWVGRAEITRVQNQLQRFEQDDDTKNYLVGEDGQHILKNSDTGLHATAQSFPLRLLVHVDANGSAKLLPAAYIGAVRNDEEGFPVLGVALSEDGLLEEHLSSAVRLSVAHLPMDTDPPDLDMTGIFNAGAILKASLTIGHDDPCNPFIHTYHPDHDSLNASDPPMDLPSGVESFSIQRDFELMIADGTENQFNPNWGTSLLTGSYSETLSGLHKKPIKVSGVFELQKLTSATIR